MATSTISALTAANSIDPSADYLAIDTANVAATQKINRNTLLGLSSAPVGLTDSQTLTNKVLTSPTINGATLSGTLSGTYTIGGTPTFPSSVVTLTGSQTLTNKVLTSPTINTPTITNATISADTLSGFTVSNNGTVYGISVSGGTIGSAALASSSVTTPKLNLSSSTDANGWTTYSFGGYTYYMKQVTFSITLAANTSGSVTLSSSTLPTAAASLGSHLLIGQPVHPSGYAWAFSWGFEMSTASAALAVTAKNNDSGSHTWTNSMLNLIFV